MVQAMETHLEIPLVQDLAQMTALQKVSLMEMTLGPSMDLQKGGSRDHPMVESREI